MKKLLYFAVGLFLLAAFAAGSDGTSSSKTEVKAEVKKAVAKCVVDREKFSNMKAGMSIFQIERDVGCSGTLASSSTFGDIHTVMITWPGSGSFGANMNATFQNDLLVRKAQFGLK
jgi:hypothetical protein